MKTTEIFSQLCLNDTEDWNVVDFIEGTYDSFYTYMIENNDICLAWVAIKDKMTEDDLIKHHFARAECVDTKIKGFIPRMLIVTDGKKWYISKLGSKKFIEVKHSTLLMSIVDDLKEIKDHYKTINIPKDQLFKITKSIDKLKRKIRCMGETHDEGEPKQADKIFEEVLPDIDDSYKELYKVGKMRADVLETMLELKSKEAQDLNELLHHQLNAKTSEKQHKFLLSVSGNHIYINPCFNKDEILIKFLPTDKYSKNFNFAQMSGEYISVKKDGEVVSYKINLSNAIKYVSPGFFKFNRNLLKRITKK